MMLRPTLARVHNESGRTRYTLEDVVQRARTGGCTHRGGGVGLSLTKSSRCPDETRGAGAA